MKAEKCLSCRYVIQDNGVLRCGRITDGINLTRYIKDCHEYEKEAVITYHGKHYKELPFGNDHPHVEPCGECAFGSKICLGTREITIKGRKKTVSEGGWECHKPDDFTPCTAPSRKDGRNVYFVLASLHRRTTEATGQ